MTVLRQMVASYGVGSSAETQSNIMPNSCYDPASFTINLPPGPDPCIDPKTGNNTSITLPLQDQKVLWFNFDVRPFAGGYDFQVIGGPDDVAWVLYYSDNPENCVDGATGLSGDCSNLTYYTCGTNFNGWAMQEFLTPIFEITSNVYLVAWDQEYSRGEDNDDDFSINFKAQYGCGRGLCIV